MIWVLTPDEKMCVEMTAAAAREKGSGEDRDLRDYDVQQTVIGEEVVNGVRATKSKIIMTGRTGDRMVRVWWTPKDGIVVKLDALATEGKEKGYVKLDLKNLRIGRVDPALFEIPAGYSRMALPSFPGGIKRPGTK